METIKVYTEADSKGSLLAEVHRLQNSLAAMRQARDFHGANSAERMHQVDRLQKEIEMSKQNVRYSREAHRKDGCVEWDGEMGYPDNRCRMCRLHDNQAKQAPAPVDAELVERMLGAYWQDARPCEACKEGQTTGMAAVLRVVADALLADPTPDEYTLLDVQMEANWAAKTALKDFLRARRARLLAPTATEPKP